MRQSGRPLRKFQRALAEVVRKRGSVWPNFVLTRFSMRDGEVSLDLIETLPYVRGRGHASRAMSDICRAADRVGTYLQLLAMQSSMDDDALDSDALDRWYRQYGFEGDAGDVLFREPRSVSGRFQ